jgi:predicted glycoside hydrolase/deacetylase ChbG (UPF0249 family)
MKRLIVNADDFGWTRGITDGIFLAHCGGLVTSTTPIANQPASECPLETQPLGVEQFVRSDAAATALSGTVDSDGASCNDATWITVRRGGAPGG